MIGGKHKFLHMVDRVGERQIKVYQSGESRED